MTQLLAGLVKPSILLANKIEPGSIVVLVVGLVATIIDIRKRIIYRRITFPVFICGLIYTLLPLQDSFQKISFTKEGIMILVYNIWIWLAPSLLVFCCVLFLFCMGIIGGGDGHFFIAITPWCGLARISIIFMYFFPIAVIYLLIYLIIQYRFDLLTLVRDQLEDTLQLARSIPTIINNIRKGENSIFTKDVTYKSSQPEKPPAMVAIYAAVIISLMM